VNTVALVFAVVGVVLALVSLGWQAATFFLSGPRVKVSFAEGLRGAHDGVMIGPPSIYTEAGREALEADGYTERVVAVTARNVGRMATTASMWAIRFGNGTLYTLAAHPRNRPVPFRLDAFEEVTWYAPLNDLTALQAQFVDQGDDAALASAVVDLASGAKVEGRTRLRIRANAGERDLGVIKPRLARVLARRGARAAHG
jgi:hypothetical protein